MRFDIHVHTTLSPCSRLKMEDILKYALKRGVDGVCITDHETTGASNYLKEGVQKNGLCLIFGMEYTTGDGDFLIFGPFENIPAGIDAAALLNLVDRMGGVAVAAHPFRKERPVNEDIITDNLCRVIEGINGRNMDIENLRVEKWRKKYTLTEVGGSDAHTLEEIGSVVTNFTIPVRSKADFVYALKMGLCYPKAGTNDI